MVRPPSVRKLRPSDFIDVLRLNAGARPHVAPLDSAELSRLAALSDAHFVDGEGVELRAYALVFARDDAYDGEEFQHFRPLLVEPFSYVDQVVVREMDRRTGVAARLYGAIERAARARGHRWMCCEVNAEPPNPGSLAFHVRLGFAVSNELSTLDGRRVCLLVKALAGNA